VAIVSISELATDRRYEHINFYKILVSDRHDLTLSIITVRSPIGR